MEQLDNILQVVNLLVFCAVIVVSLAHVVRTRSRAATWFCLTFLSLGFVLVAGMLVDPAPSTSAARWFRKFDISILLLFPYLLFRFEASFREPSRWADRIATTLTVSAIVATFAVPELPQAGNHRPIWYFVLILLQWSSVLLMSAGRLWIAGRRQPSVVRRRLRLIAVAATLMALALLIAAAAPGDVGDANGFSIASKIVASVSAIAFYLGYAPPIMMRVIWRSPEQDAVQRAIIDVMRITDVRGITESLLPYLPGLVGGAGAAALLHDGSVLGVHNADPAQLEKIAASVRRGELREGMGGDSGTIRLRVPFGWLVVWASAYTPFFGEDEINLLRSLGVITSLALDHVDLIDQQREIAERLAEVNDMKNEFIAMVAHDLRSPMTVISGFADTIVARWDDLSDHEKIEYLSMISRNTGSLAQLVEDVLQVARVESGEFTYEMAAFDLRRTIRRTVDELQVSNAERRFMLDLPEQLPEALGDEERNWQILTNLLSNALKFSAEDTPIDVKVGVDGDELLVTVADHGIGISLEDQPRLFQKFSRIEPVDRSKRAKGTGLGLYIVKSMIEAQGGRIWVESSPAAGSCFTYSLPIAPGSSRAK